MEKVTANQAAKLLGIPVDKLGILEKQGLIHSSHNTEGVSLYSSVEIAQIESRRGPTLADEAAVIGTEIQHDIVSSVTFTRKVFMLVGGALSGYVLLVAVFTALFIINPLQTAGMLGYVAKIENNQGKKVLAASTSSQAIKSPTLVQTLLAPVGNVSLGIVKIANPQAYSQVAKVTILDTNDILAVDANGAITPKSPINLPQSSLLQVGSNDVVANLNSQYLQGKQPGANPGDIAIVGATAATTPTPAPINTNQAISGLTATNLTAGDFSSKINTGTYAINITGNVASATNFTGSLAGAVTGTQGATVISGLTTANFSSPNISQWTNNSGYLTAEADTIATVTGRGATTSTALTLSNSSNSITAGTLTATGGTINGTTIGATSPSTGVFTTINGLTITNNGSNTLNIAAGKTLTVSSSISFGGTDGTTFTLPATSDTLIGRASTDTLTNKTIAAGSNTITGLTNSNLSGSAGITNANLANSSIAISGNSGSGSVSLGGGLTFTGAGITNIVASGSTLTVTSTEADTLQSVYGRGNTITTTTGSNIAFTLPSGLITPTSLTLTNNGTADSFLLTDAVNANFGTTTRRSLLINPGAITQNTAAATGIYSGLDITLPALTLTSGTALTGNGVRITTDGLTQTAGTLTSNGLLVDSTSSTITTGGTINGVKINAPTTIPSVGTYNNLFLGTSTGIGTTNAYDAATIAVGNIASNAQQNFSTLNIKNGGTGYLDIELIKGFINFQGMNTLYDDFTGNALDVNTKWNASPTGSGSSCDLLPGGLNGLLRMAAGGAANRRCELSTQATLSNGYYQRGNNPIAETKLKIDVTTNVRIFAGFTNTAPTAGNDTNVSTQHAYIEKLAAGTQFQCVTDNGGATETTTSTGVTMNANTFYRLRVELRNGTTPETICTIDDGTTVTRTVVTATQPGATSAMDIYLKVETSNTTAKNMDVDYVRVWQDDPSPGLVMNNNSLPPIANDSVKIASLSATPSAILPIKEKVASDSGSLVELVANSVNNFFKNLVEFFGNVIFHADVTFLGRPTFNKDTAGHAFIKAGDSEVRVVFEKEYAQNPVVTASVNLVGGVKADEVPLYAVYDLSTKSFTIKLSKAAAFDLSFSWIALAVSGGDISTNSVSVNPTPIPTVAPSTTPVVTPEITPSPIPTVTVELTPPPAGGSTASPSASTP